MFRKLLAKNLSGKERQQLGSVAEDALQQYAGHERKLFGIVFTYTEKLKQRSSAKNNNSEHLANFSNSPYNFAQECVIEKGFCLPLKNALLRLDVLSLA